MQSNTILMLVILSSAGIILYALKEIKATNDHFLKNLTENQYKIYKELLEKKKKKSK